MWQIVIALLFSDTVTFLLFSLIRFWMNGIRCWFGAKTISLCRTHAMPFEIEKKKKTVQIDRSILRTHMSTIWITVIRDVDIVFIYNFACSDYKRIIWLWNNKRNIYSVWRFRFFFFSLINSHCVWHVRIKFTFFWTKHTRQRIFVVQFWAILFIELINSTVSKASKR